MKRKKKEKRRRQNFKSLFDIMTLSDRMVSDFFLSEKDLVESTSFSGCWPSS